MRGLFKNFWVYALVGFVFTLVLYRGSWIDFVKFLTGWRLDKSLLNSLVMMAGVADPVPAWRWKPFFRNGGLDSRSCGNDARTHESVAFSGLDRSPPVQR